MRAGKIGALTVITVARAAELKRVLAVQGLHPCVKVDSSIGEIRSRESFVGKSSGNIHCHATHLVDKLLESFKIYPNIVRNFDIKSIGKNFPREFSAASGVLCLAKRAGAVDFAPVMPGNLYSKIARNRD